MSLFHSLEIATGLAPEQVVNIMSDRLAPESRDENSLRVSGLFVIINRSTGLGQSVIEDDFGFRPNLSVVFEVYPEEDYAGGMRAMMRGAMALLEHEAGHAVMLANGERAMLQRLEGNLLLNERWDNWTAHAQLLPEVTLPYQLGFVASPALDESVPTSA